MKNRFYYQGGLAEIVNRPSDITFEYLERWFTGFGCLGRAMKILGLPYTPMNKSVLVRREGELYVDLKTEEETLYRDTIFSYLEPEDEKDPKMVVNFLKVFSLRCWIGTIWLLAAQTKWIVNPDLVITRAEKMLSELREKTEETELIKIDEVLFGFVWPRVIAVGTWTEFYEKLLAKEDVDGLQRKELSLVMAKDDWFFRSYAEMNKVKQGELSLLKFVKEYGIRADVDYELTCPRWYEDKVALMKKIKKAKNSENNNEVVGCSSYSKYFEIVREMYKIRTETKKETLRFIGALRAELLKRGRLEKISVKSKKVKKEVRVVKNGSGMGVSEGSVSGKVKVYGVGKDVILSNAIGVFPNASPEYSIFYPHCKGIIFLRGGMTSHGVIVAREYGIPALVDAAAECLKRGERVVINGSSGEWQVVKK